MTRDLSIVESELLAVQSEIAEGPSGELLDALIDWEADLHNEIKHIKNKDRSWVLNSLKSR